MILAAILLGILLGLICYEITGISVGGIIAPGYIALFLFEPIVILNLVCALGFTYLLTWIFSRRIFLFGRRLLLTSMILGFISHSLLQPLLKTDSIVDSNILLLGALIPGEINYEFHKQGIKKTVVALTATALLLRVALTIISSM